MYLGIDVGSVSTNLVAYREGRVLKKLYLRTRGKPVEAVQRGMAEFAEELSAEPVEGVGATGSGRQLAGMMVGADVIKNEITAHGAAAARVEPKVRTVLEIGGQDSKIIFLKDGVVRDFAMNTVCAAGTGSFLDRQAARLGMDLQEFGELALKSRKDVPIAGRCAVFAESDMIHKQQAGYAEADIVAGLCRALVRNYLNNLARGKQLEGPVLFQGGVAANPGIVRAFERELGLMVVVPDHFEVMGALGAALLAEQAVQRSGVTHFRGWGGWDREYATQGFACQGCANSCEVMRVLADGKTLAVWGDQCGRWSEVRAHASAE